LAAGIQGTATAWLALEAGGGGFGVGLVLAARMLPNLLFGLAAGTLADRANRNRLLVVVALAGVPVMLALSWLAAAGNVAIWQLVPLSFATGCLFVFDVPARQALVMDTVPREVAPNAMALNAMASRLCTALGALAAGALIANVSVASCYLAVALAYALAAGLMVLVRPSRSATGRIASQRLPFGRALREAARMVYDVAAVRTLILAGIACEVFGFSFQTATPVFARDVLTAGPEGLGTLNAATAIGGTLSVLTLSLLPGRVRREPVLGLVFLFYGVSLVVLAQSQSLAVAAAALLVTGACAAAFDLLQQTLIQLAVPEEQRGRAVGVWVLGIGSAPLGHLEMGTLIATLSAPVALSINGAVVLLGAATLLARAPTYRWLLRPRPAD
jgi:predicted MFS family arabinose efflux permease